MPENWSNQLTSSFLADIASLSGVIPGGLESAMAPQFLANNFFVYIFIHLTSELMLKN